jgi:hypothetical protein
MNPHEADILDNIFLGQISKNRPNITARVFERYAREIINILEND